MGLELAEQFDWALPDVIIYPTGGGTGLIGMWKAFHELKTLGWLKSDKMPRMIVPERQVRAIAVAFERGERFAGIREPSTIATGLRVPAAVGDFMISMRSGKRGVAGHARTGHSKWMRLVCAKKVSRFIPKRRFAGQRCCSSVARSTRQPHSDFQHGRNADHGASPRNCRALTSTSRLNGRNSERGQQVWTSSSLGTLKPEVLDRLTANTALCAIARCGKRFPAARPNPRAWTIIIRNQTRLTGIVGGRSLLAIGRHGLV
jgi:hypothetical protein